MLANAAFYYGVIRKLAADDRPVWTKMSFAVAEQNFHTAARDGMDAILYWPGYGQVGADELVLRHLLPLAHEGLKEWGVSDTVRERYLSVIEGRCKTGSNGATWQTQAVERLEEQGMDRQRALSRMLELYVQHMHSNEPVHTWPLP